MSSDRAASSDNEPPSPPFGDGSRPSGCEAGPGSKLKAKVTVAPLNWEALIESVIATVNALIRTELHNALVKALIDNHIAARDQGKLANPADDVLPDDWEDNFFWRAVLDMAAAGDLDLGLPSTMKSDGGSAVPTYSPAERSADTGTGPNTHTSPPHYTAAAADGIATGAPRPADAATVADGSACGVSNIQANFYVSTPASQRWYLVTRGRRVGVFQGNHIAQSLILGVPGCTWHGVASEQEGAEQFTEALIAGAVAVFDDQRGMVTVDAQFFDFDNMDDGVKSEEQDSGHNGMNGEQQGCELSVDE